MKHMDDEVVVFRGRAFSILERIDVGETGPPALAAPQASSFSILERIDVGETILEGQPARVAPGRLSVSSNGSTWVKRVNVAVGHCGVVQPFSILERIDVGETTLTAKQTLTRSPLSVSSNGSTWVKRACPPAHRWKSPGLSVSSNGSTWVKRLYLAPSAAMACFQYPRTDRRG